MAARKIIEDSGLAIAASSFEDCAEKAVASLK